MATDHNFRIKNGLEVGGQEVISSSGVVTSAALGGQTLSSTDSPTFDNLTLTGSLRGPATMTIDPAAVGDNTGTLVIAGNLQVDGTTTTINSTSLSVDDLNITLASGAANAAAADGAGLTVDGASATLTYNSAGDDWRFNKGIQSTGELRVIPSTGETVVIARDSTSPFIGTNSNHDLRLITNGTTALTLNTSNNSKFSGALGVAITGSNPAAQLHVYSVPAEGFRLEGNDEYVYNSYYGTVSSTQTRLGYIGFANQTGTATDFNFVNDQSGNFTFDTLSATRLEISASMINANTDVTITTANEPHLRLNKSTTGGQTAILLREQGTTRTQLTSNFSDDKFYLYHGGVNALTLDGTGQARFTGAFEVGSGVGNTRSTIDTNGTYFHYYDTETSPRIQLGRDIGISGGAGVGFGGNGAYALIGTNDTSGTNLYFKTNATVATVTTDPDMTILSTGKVGISNSSPNYLLEVGSATQTESNIFSGRVNGDFIFNLSKANTNLYSIRNNGNSVVHVNTQNSARLALGVSSGTGTGTIEEQVTITADGNVGINKSSGFTVGGFAAGLGPNLVMKQRVNSQWGGINIEAEGNDSILAVGSSNDAHYIGTSYRSSAGYKPLKVVVAGNERMNITTGGIVCIGSGHDTPQNSTDALSVQGGDLEVRDTVNANSGGRIYAMDYNHSIYFREGAANKTNYYQYGGNRGQGLGHKFYTGGPLVNQALKLQIADDDVFVSGVSLTVRRNSGNIRIETASDPSNYFATINSNYNYGQAFSITACGASTERTIMTWADGAGMVLDGGYGYSPSATPIKVQGRNILIDDDGVTLPEGDNQYLKETHVFEQASNPPSYSTSTNQTYTGPTSQKFPITGEVLIGRVAARAYTRYLNIRTNMTADNQMFYFRTMGYFYSYGMEECYAGGYTYGNNTVLSKDYRRALGDTHNIVDLYRDSSGFLCMKIDINHQGYTEGKMYIYYGHHEMANSSVKGVQITDVIQRDDGVNAF